MIPQNFPAPWTLASPSGPRHRLQLGRIQGLLAQRATERHQTPPNSSIQATTFYHWLSPASLEGNADATISCARARPWSERNAGVARSSWGQPVRRAAKNAWRRKKNGNEKAVCGYCHVFSVTEKLQSCGIRDRDKRTESPRSSDEDSVGALYLDVRFGSSCLSNARVLFLLAGSRSRPGSRSPCVREFTGSRSIWDASVG
jgi:hypothetical protein